MSSQKKETLQKILEALIPYRDMAEWFLLLINEEQNDELIENLYQEILKNMKNIKSKGQEEKIKAALQKLKEKSEKVTKTDEKEAEKMLDNLLVTFE